MSRVRTGDNNNNVDDDDNNKTRSNNAVGDIGSTALILRIFMHAYNLVLFCLSFSFPVLGNYRQRKGRARGEEEEKKETESKNKKNG